MTDNNELLEKVIVTSTKTPGSLGASGLLAPVQADRFIDYVFDQTVLGPQIRTERIRGDEAELDRISVGERLMRLATEAVDDGMNVGVAFTKVSLSTRKLRLDWELSTETLEDNIEGEALEDHIARLMATQVGNDLEDVAINGDTTQTTDPLLKAFDGWGRLGRTGGIVVDANELVDDTDATTTAATTGIHRGVFNAALKAVPRKYMQQRGQLKFFAGSNVVQDWLSKQLDMAIGANPTGVADQRNLNGPAVVSGGYGFQTPAAFGLGIQEVPLFEEIKDGDYSGATGDHADVWLTFPKNLIWGIKREIKVVREYKPKKDTNEWTMMCRVGTAVENPDTFVVVKNVKVS
jgi:hypothetical protein